MREETDDCIRPWNEGDAALISAALRWVNSKRPSASRNTRAVCERAVRRDDEIPLRSPEAYYVVIPAAERLILEAGVPEASSAERREKLSAVARLYARRGSMSPQVAARLESAVGHGIAKRGLIPQWNRVLAAQPSAKEAGGRSCRIP